MRKQYSKKIVKKGAKLGRLANGYGDDDMTDDYVAWLVEYAPSEVFPIDNERAIEFARQNPKLVWIESTYEKAYLIPLGPRVNDNWGLEEQMKDNSHWVNGRVYICKIPFDKPKDKSEDWVLVGAEFACEDCKPAPGEEGAAGCTTCSGEGWTWLTVYDNDVREELEEACTESEVSLPIGFPSTPVI